MSKAKRYIGFLVIILLVIVVSRSIFLAIFFDIESTILLESVSGEGVCKSNFLVKNKGQEDMVILKNIMYEKDIYLGSYVSPETKCNKIFYSQFGDYVLPTMSPVKGE
jgi:hypothetical protein